MQSVEDSGTRTLPHNEEEFVFPGRNKDSGHFNGRLI